MGSEVLYDYGLSTAEMHWKKIKQVSTSQLATSPPTYPQPMGSSNPSRQSPHMQIADSSVLDTVIIDQSHSTLDKNEGGAGVDQNLEPEDRQEIQARSRVLRVRTVEPQDPAQECQRRLKVVTEIASHSSLGEEASAPSANVAPTEETLAPIEDAIKAALEASACRDQHTKGCHDDRNKSFKRRCKRKREEDDSTVSDSDEDESDVSLYQPETNGSSDSHTSEESHWDDRETDHETDNPRKRVLKKHKSITSNLTATLPRVQHNESGYQDQWTDNQNSLVDLQTEEDDEDDSESEPDEDDIIRDTRVKSIYVKMVKKSSTTSAGAKKKSDRVYNSTHACPFCCKMVTNFSQHLRGKKHQREPEIMELMNLQESKNDDQTTQDVKQEKRKKLLSILRNRGDNMHNVKVLKKQKGELLLSRRMNESPFTKEDYGPCPSCLEWLKCSVISRHQRSCPAKQNNSQFLTKGSLLLQSNIISGRISGNPSLTLKKEVLPMMKHDQVGKVVREDALIIAIGNDYMKRNVGNRLMRKHYASAVMRLMARLLINLRSLATPFSGVKLEDYLVPQHFSHVAEATIKTCQPDDADEENLKAPSHALKLGTDLKRVTSIILANAIKKGDNSRRRAAKDFLTLMSIEWSTKLERVLLQERKNKKKQPLPLPKDVERFAVFLKEEALSADLKDYSYTNFRKNAIIALTNLICYNRRRPGEVQALSLADYSARKTGVDEVGREVLGKITKFEQYLIEAQDVIMIRGKHGKFVPLLISEHVRPILAFLTGNHVRSVAGIPTSNNYVFANCAAGVIRGGFAIAKMAAEAGLQLPERMRATNCRKFMATMIQGLDVTPQQQRWIIDHLGHTLDVHHIHYRATSDLLERIDIAKLLLMMDFGKIADFKGQKIQDIQLDELYDKTGIDENTCTANETGVDENTYTVDETGGDQEEEFIPDLMQLEETLDGDVPVSVERIQRKRKATTRHNWSTEEINEVNKLFKSFLDSDKTPGEKAVAAAMRKSKQNGGSIWKLKLKNIKSKVSWIRLHVNKKYH
ncbi:uncharacterized protein LOC135156624 [Lytechinus pictus]|uniref:uncharacterized protein LOC135156624 n=1 Tax=Lytechinus pictus TaxID=7653 RepID=UPI0030B9E874